MRLKIFFLFLISLLIGIGLFFLIIKFVGWQEIKKPLLVFRGWQGLVILGFTFLEVLIATWRWQEILKRNQLKIPFFELFKIYLAGSSITYLAPVLFGAGEVFRGYSLKEKQKINFSKTMASVILEKILDWTDNLVVIFFGVLFFIYKMILPPKNLWIIFGSGFLFFTAMICLFYFKAFKRESMTKVFIRIFNHQIDSKPLEIEEEIFNFFKPPRKSLWGNFCLAFFGSFVSYLKFGFLLSFLGKGILPLATLSILASDYLATITPIPTALGSRETIQTFIFEALNIGAPTAIAFTTIVRVAELILALIGITIFLRSGISLFKNTLNNKIEKQ